MQTVIVNGKEIQLSDNQAAFIRQMQAAGAPERDLPGMIAAAGTQQDAPVDVPATGWLGKLLGK